MYLFILCFYIKFSLCTIFHTKEVTWLHFFEKNNCVLFTPKEKWKTVELVMIFPQASFQNDVCVNR
jgi:hypothetical protein